jgi:hypothetical protein
MLEALIATLALLTVVALKKRAARNRDVLSGRFFENHEQ